MSGVDGLVRTYRLSSSVRWAKFCALIIDPTNTTTVTGALFVKPPTSSNQGPVQGVTVEHYVEPNYFVAEDTDPSTISGTTPNSPYASMLGGTAPLQIGPSLQYTGQARCYVTASGSITPGKLVLIADAYGRVDSASHLGISGGTLIYPVGIARSASSGTNSIVLVELVFLPVAYVSGQ